MWQSLRNLSDPENSYDCDHWCRDVSNRATCCVPFDSEELETRCCFFGRSSRDKFDYLDCGYHGENMIKDPDHYQRDAIKRRVRWAYVLQAVFWTALGAWLLINPETTMFMASPRDNTDMESFNVEGFVQFQMESDHMKKHQDTGFSSLISKMAIGPIFEKIFASDSATEEEKDALVRKVDNIFKESSDKVARHAVVTANKIAGGAFIYVGLTSLSLRSAAEVTLDPSISTNHLMWNACMMLALAAAAPGSAGHLITFLLILNAVSAVFWFFTRDAIMRLKIAKQADDSGDADT